MRRSISRSTSEVGTSNGTRGAELLHQIGAQRPLGLVLRLVFEVLADARLQRVQRVELAQVFRELVVQFRQHAAFEPLDGHCI
jgi:hypothetical protein